MKKFIAKIVAAALLLTALATLCACGGSAKAAPAEVYTTQYAFVEAGYEGDCVNNVANTLVLNADGTYTYINNFTVNQVGGVVVFYTTDFYTGTYKVDSTADGVKTVTLAAPTAAVSNGMGTATTSAEDASLLEGFGGATVTCDTANNQLGLQ